MDDYFTPSQFVNELQSGQSHDDNFSGLDLDAIAAEYFGAEIAEDQVLEFTDEFTNPQAPASSETPGVDRPQQDDLSNEQIQLPDGLDDLFEDQEPWPSTEEGLVSIGDQGDVSASPKTTPFDHSPNNRGPRASRAQGEHEPQHNSNDIVTQQREVPSLPESGSQNNSGIYDQQHVDPPRENRRYQPESSDVVQGQEGLTHLPNIAPADALSRDNQSHLDPLALGAANIQGIDQPADGLDDRGILPNFDWDVLASPEWKDFRERAAGMELEEILGTDFLPATPNQNGTAFQHSPGPSDLQAARTVMIPAADPPTAGNYEAVDDENPEELDEGSEGNTPDQPEFETYEENDSMIHPDPLQRGWGRTGRRNGQEVWFNPGTSLWQPSATHHDMRGVLIERAQAEYPNDRYLHPDPTDGLPHGETAFFKPHQNRGPDRDQCADELFIWREYKSKKDENGKPIRRAKPLFSIRDHPGFMYEGDRILLDPHNHPVVNHKFIPLTLSAYTDGGKLQEMALRPGCRQLDLWARMPRWEKKTDKNGNSEIISLRDKNTRINMPMTRFREKKGTLAGGDREGTEVIMEGLTKFYHYHGFDPVAAGNSVKAFPRDLTREVKEVRLGNTARFGGRAGNRALDDEKREDNLQKTLKAIENGRKKQAAKDGNISGKRRLEDEEGGSQGSSARPSKRSRRGQEVDHRLTALNEGYAPMQEAPAFQDSRNGYGIQGSSYPQHGIHPQASGPSQVHSNAYDAGRSPYQRSDFQAQPQGPTHFQRILPNAGPYSIPAQARVQQAPYGGVHMQAGRSPYENVPVQAPSNNRTRINRNNPEGQYHRGSTGIRRAPTLGLRQPQQNPYRTDRHDTFKSDNRNTAQSGPMSQTHPGHHSSGPVSSNPYGTPVQRQEPHEANAAPRRTGNTLGPGGRGSHHLPQQVLGKRGHQVVGDIDVHGNQTSGSQQQPIDIEATADLEYSAPVKRRRTQGNHDTVRPQQRQHQPQRPQRTPRPQYYGAEGAPIPLLPPNEFIGSPQSTPLYNGYQEGRLMSPEEVSRQLSGVFESPNPMPNINRSASQFMGSAPRQPEYVQRAPQGYQPPQVLGTHRRGEPTDQLGEDMYVPQQNLGQQGPGRFYDAPEQQMHMPQPNRRRMPGSEGYYTPPAQLPTAQLVNNAHLPSPQLYNNQHVPSYHQAPQVEGARRIPPQHSYINGPPIYNNPSPQVAHTQSQPLAPMSSQTGQRTRSDMRNVRPSNGQESQSIHNALSYTRDVFREWTGLEAPVTNLEDSYNVQYREIRAEFRAWWRSGDNPQRMNPMPELWRMPRWRGTIENWGVQ